MDEISEKLEHLWNKDWGEGQYNLFIIYYNLIDISKGENKSNLSEINWALYYMKWIKGQTNLLNTWWGKVEIFRRRKEMAIIEMWFSGKMQLSNDSQMWITKFGIERRCDTVDFSNKRGLLIISIQTVSTGNLKVSTKKLGCQAHIQLFTQRQAMVSKDVNEKITRTWYQNLWSVWSGSSDSWSFCEYGARGIKLLCFVKFYQRDFIKLNEPTINLVTG